MSACSSAARPCVFRRHCRGLSSARCRPWRDEATMDRPKTPTVANPWQALRQFTRARIALGRAGTSLPTGPHLEFQLAHARARDAVHHPLAIEPLRKALEQRGREVIALHSAAGDRPIYLQRPDQGRRLDRDSHRRLEGRASQSRGGVDAALFIAARRPPFSLEENAVAFLDAIL